MTKIVTGRYLILVFRDGRFERAIPVIKRWITVGRDKWCDVRLDDSAVPMRYGVIADKRSGVVVEPEGGEIRPLAPFELLDIGPFTLVRVPAGSEVEVVAAEIEARLAGSGPSAGTETAMDRAPRGGELESAAPDEPAPTGAPPPVDSWAPPPPHPFSTAAPEWPSPPPYEPARPGIDLAQELDLGPPLAIGGEGAGAAGPVSHRDSTDRSSKTAAPSSRPAAAAAAPPPTPPRPFPAAVGARMVGALAPPKLASVAPPTRVAPPQPLRAPPPSRGGHTKKEVDAAMAVPGGPRPVARSAGNISVLCGAPAPAAAPADFALACEDAGPGGSLDRRTTVRHYAQMNPGRTYPLLVIISAGKIERSAAPEVTQVSSEEGFAIERENPTVRIEPVLPGCAVAPAAIELDCTAAVAEARFAVTPIVLGAHADARIEVRYAGKLVDTVPIPARVAKQTVAKLSAALSLFELAAPVFESMGGAAEPAAPAGGLRAAFHAVEGALGGSLAASLLVACAAAFVALVFYLRNRAREGDPIERLLDYSAAVAADEDLSVSRLRARLLVLLDGARRSFPIKKALTSVGRSGACDLAIDHGSLEDRSAIVRFDGAALTIAPATPRVAVVIEGRAVEREAALSGNEMLLRLGRVPLLYLREAHDESIDRTDVRERIASQLESRLAAFADDIRRAFADERRPVRAAAADLLVAGKLDVPTWREVVAAARAG